MPDAVTELLSYPPPQDHRVYSLALGYDNQSEVKCMPEDRGSGTEFAVIASTVKNIYEDVKELKRDNKKTGEVLARVEIQLHHQEAANKALDDRVTTLENLEGIPDHDCEQQPAIVELNTKTQSLLAWRKTLAIIAITSFIGLLGLGGATIWAASALNSDVHHNTKDIKDLEDNNEKMLKVLHGLEATRKLHKAER